MEKPEADEVAERRGFNVVTKKSHTTPKTSPATFQSEEGRPVPGPLEEPFVGIYCGCGGLLCYILTTASALADATFTCGKCGNRYDFDGCSLIAKPQEAGSPAKL